MWMGIEHNLGVRVERPLSGPTVDAILEPRYEQEEHRAFLEEDIWGQWASNSTFSFFFHFDKIVVPYCTSWRPPYSAVISSMTMTELYIRSVFRNETCLFWHHCFCERERNQTGEDSHQLAESVKNNSSPSVCHLGEVKPWLGPGTHQEVLAQLFFP